MSIPATSSPPSVSTHIRTRRDTDHTQAAPNGAVETDRSIPESRRDESQTRLTQRVAASNRFSSISDRFSSISDSQLNRVVAMVANAPLSALMEAQEAQLPSLKAFVETVEIPERKEQLKRELAGLEITVQLYAQRRAQLMAELDTELDELVRSMLPQADPRQRAELKAQLMAVVDAQLKAQLKAELDRLVDKVLPEGDPETKELIKKQLNAQLPIEWPWQLKARLDMLADMRKEQAQEVMDAMIKGTQPRQADPQLKAQLVTALRSHFQTAWKRAILDNIV